VYLPALTLTLLALPCPAQEPLAEGSRLLAEGDYPAAEKAFEQACARIAESERGARGIVLARMAEARALQGIAEGSVESIRQALSLSTAAEVRRSAVMVFLGARRYSELREQAEELLKLKPGDPGLRFARGLALAKTGDLEEALADLRAAPGRNARFELALCLAKLGRPRDALEPLLEILASDPYDAEACWQASRQLISLGGGENARLASALIRYFEALRAQEGQSSRAEHLAFAGKAVGAALERARRWERLGAVEQAIREVRQAEQLPGGEAAKAWLEEYCARLGFPGLPGARALEEALAGAEANLDSARAQRAAKLLLAVDPGSAAALRRLLLDTQDPSLVVPRWHYLTRLAAAAPFDEPVKAELTKLRASLAGSARGR